MYWSEVFLILWLMSGYIMWVKSWLILPSTSSSFSLEESSSSAESTSPWIFSYSSSVISLLLCDVFQIPTVFMKFVYNGWTFAQKSWWWLGGKRWVANCRQRSELPDTVVARATWYLRSTFFPKSFFFSFFPKRKLKHLWKHCPVDLLTYPNLFHQPNNLYFGSKIGKSLGSRCESPLT